MAVLTVLSLCLGQLLDSRLGTEPWLLLLFTIGGFGVGLGRLVQGLNRLQKADEEHPTDDP